MSRISCAEVFRWLRRKAAHIRYHSAARPVSRWSRAVDMAFIGSFLLALPAALVADLTRARERVSIELPGVLSHSSARNVEAWLMTPAVSRTNSPRGRGPRGEGDQVILGNFVLTVTERLRGWPLTTTIEAHPARLNIDIMREPRPRDSVPRDQTDPLQRAIELELVEDQRHEALAAWNQARTRARTQWWAWFPTFGAWWMLLFVSASLIIQTLRFGSHWLTRQRAIRAAQRQHQGLCAACGYDMKGLEFNERCPECGAQVW